MQSDEVLKTKTFLGANYQIWHFGELVLYKIVEQ